MSGEEQKPIIGNVADAKQIKKAKLTEEQERLQELNDFADILNTPGGRRFIWKLLGKAGVFELSFSFTEKDTVTAFREGRRNVGLQYLKDINEEFPEAYALMAKEAKGKK